MSQTSQQAPPAPWRQPVPGAGAAGQPVPPGHQVVTGRLVPTGAPAPGRGPWASLRRGLQGSPGRLRLVAAVTALAAAVFGLLGGNTLWSSSGALERADLNTTQVVRVQSIYTDLVRADAAATNAFLVGGLEDPVQRRDYDDAIARVAAQIADAARAQPADSAALGALNQQVQQYSSLVEQARAYNRQGLPIGAQYLGNASAGLRSTALPVVNALTAANTERADLEFDNSGSGLALAIAGALSLVVLILAMVFLARRSHRYLNVSLSIALVLVLVALVSGAATLASVRSTISTAQRSSVSATLQLATIQSTAYDAKANESLTLIKRGSGDANEKAWTDGSTLIDATIDAISGPASGTTLAQDLADQWGAYKAAHAAIRTQDDGGQYDAAVRLAVAPASTTGSANQLFQTFVDTVDRSLDAYQATASAAVTSPRTRTTVLGWALLVVCVAAAGLALRGFGQRLEEYR